MSSYTKPAATPLEFSIQVSEVRTGNQMYMVSTVVVKMADFIALDLPESLVREVALETPTSPVDQDSVELVYFPFDGVVYAHAGLMCFRYDLETKEITLSPKKDMYVVDHTATLTYNNKLKHKLYVSNGMLCYLVIVEYENRVTVVFLQKYPSTLNLRNVRTCTTGQDGGYLCRFSTTMSNIQLVKPRFLTREAFEAEAAAQ